MIPTDELFDKLIEAWHLWGAGPGKSIYDWLLVTQEEYGRFLATREVPEDWQPNDEHMEWIS